jgi:hypothetical protein
MTDTTTEPNDGTYTGDERLGTPIPQRDPAPHPIDVARQRASDLVRNIADNTKLALRSRRDEIDNTIARIEKSEAALSHFIGEFARFNHDGLEMATEVKKLLDEIATPFKADPPATLTQLKNGGNT